QREPTGVSFPAIVWLEGGEENARHDTSTLSFECNMPLPAVVVGGWEIRADVDAAGFFALACSGDHEARNFEHVLQFPALGIVELSRQDVAAPAVDVFRGLGEPPCFAADAAGTPHERFERVTNVAQIERLAPVHLERILQ